MKNEPIHILGIETSCDETAAAIVTNGHEVQSSIVASSQELHEKYGGVVPEIASRAHIENTLPVLQETLEKAKLAPEQIHAVAVANQPGLTIALVVGVTAAKTLAFMWNKPLIAINHVHAHLQSALLDSTTELALPAVALIVSGGHTSLYDCSSALDLKLLGQTMDDAAGEAFDKVASILNLPYPGGPSIEIAARRGNPRAIRFPRTLLAPDSLDFSFSGIKTAVLYHCHGQDMKGDNQVGHMSDQEIADIAASFQAAVVDVLTKKTKRAVERIQAQTIILGGGVAANTSLRTSLQQLCDKSRPTLAFRVAPRQYCTDNAVMVASLAYHKYQAGMFSDLTLEAKASSD